MRSPHLDPERLLADVLEPLDEEHLAGCVTCRAERRLQRVVAPAPSSGTWATLSTEPHSSGSGDETTEARPSVATTDPADRYTDLGPIGAGGMGEVKRVLDRELNRSVAMKFVHAAASASASVVDRFVAEVQTTAQLQHPGIVPVYDTGRLADGRVYFTMKEVHGRTFGEVIRDAHPPGQAIDGSTLRRLVGHLHHVSQAVGYAHERGVVHRDLKPANVMIGDHGEVQVMDWGLCKVLGRAEAVGEEVVLQRSRGATVVGSVMGTPGYMAPEQARGDIDAIDPRTDVYALGVMLYELLSGRPPYSGRTDEVLRQVLAGPPRPLSPTAHPEALVAACGKAMAREAADRFPSAQALARELEAWLDGSKRREQALVVVERAAATLPEAAGLRARAAELRAAAEADLAGVAGWEAEERKVAAWVKEDEAGRLDLAAGLLSLQEESLLRAALTHDAGLPEAHAALVARYLGEHAEAEVARSLEGAARAEARLREHAEALPEAHPARTRCATYLKGDGALTLVTDPEGAAVDLFRYEVHNRRLVEVFEESLGRTPLRAVPLGMGSYLCRVRHPQRAEVRYPVHLGRGEHWDGVPPEGGEAWPVPLPGVGELGADDVYVPGGWFWSGEPDANQGLPRRRLWCGGLVVKRFPVTNREYLVFLNDLVAQGREEEAERWLPRERGALAGEEAVANYERTADGRYQLRHDPSGDQWYPEWPVVNVGWGCAAAYCRWLADREGGWRLPGELEWEKAARGVDGRRFPWGDRSDPSWFCGRDSHATRALPVVVESFGSDVSVYGVRGMGGNTQDWCGDEVYDRQHGPGSPGGRVVPPAPHEVEGTSRLRRGTRGGFWDGTAGLARCGTRFGLDLGVRAQNLGLRPARSFHVG